MNLYLKMSAFILDTRTKSVVFSHRAQQGAALLQDDTGCRSDGDFTKSGDCIFMIGMNHKSQTMFLENNVVQV